uniref:probable alcohol sulfotransferase n=1 Tax=Maylandia zebra TaxID=106582 RepID=UPI000D305215|nr:probable alcohol sulfotransferase [Maylandia zebra]
MIGYKKSFSEWQCLSEAKMDSENLEQSLCVRVKGVNPYWMLRALKRHCTTNRNATVKEITEWAQEYFQKPLSVNTIHRAIRRCQLKLYSAKKKPFLSKIHKLRRFHWARDHFKWSVAKWKTVLWSDESRFEVLFGNVGRHVIRTKEDKDNPSCYQRSVQKPASLMDYEKEIDRLCSFLGLSPSAEEKERIRASVTFDSMKQNKMTNYTTARKLNHEVSPFMRKGKVGDWKNHFTVAQNEQFDEDYKKKMKNPDLKFRCEIQRAG